MDQSGDMKTTTAFVLGVIIGIPLFILVKAITDRWGFN